MLGNLIHDIFLFKTGERSTAKQKNIRQMQCRCTSCGFIFQCSTMQRDDNKYDGRFRFVAELYKSIPLPKLNEVLFFFFLHNKFSNGLC